MLLLLLLMTMMTMICTACCAHILQHLILFRHKIARLEVSFLVPTDEYGIALAHVSGARFGEKTGKNVLGTREGIDLRRIYKNEFIKTDEVRTFMQVGARPTHVHLAFYNGLVGMNYHIHTWAWGRRPGGG